MTNISSQSIKKIPQHVVIIPDGNRRWARERGLPTFEGHRRGFQRAIEIGKKAREMGIKYFTLWGFSTENWHRSKEEVNYLMQLFKQMVDQHLQEALKNKIKIIHFGRKDRFDLELKNKLIKAEEETKDFYQYYLGLALDYGGRDEILRAIEKIGKRFKDQIKSSLLQNSNRASFASEFKIEEGDFSKYLDTKEFPDPDLVIRTSGEIRTSGLMIWQTAYAEWIFYQKYFPDFTPNDLEKCIYQYINRQRRFGK